MNVWLHSTIAGVAMVATVAVAVAGVALYDGGTPSAKGDRQVITEAAPTPSVTYVTVETRGDGVSILTRVPETTQLAAR